MFLELIRRTKLAKGFIGTKEVGNNGGYWVQRFQKVSNAPRGAQWCACFVNFCLDSAGVKGLPNTRNGLARSLATKTRLSKQALLTDVCHQALLLCGVVVIRSSDMLV